MKAPARTSVRDALDGAIAALGAGGCETPRLDAELLTAHVLGVDRARLLTDSELPVEGPAARALQAAVRRRAVDREPVAYIIGARHFRRLELRVDHRALIPRPESELLVEVALTAPAGASVLDLCTGSGAVALAVKDERPDLAVTGSDISAPALALARENARAARRWRSSFVQADLLDGLDDRYDLVLANPPYVADGDGARWRPRSPGTSRRSRCSPGPTGSTWCAGSTPRRAVPPGSRASPSRSARAGRATRPRWPARRDSRL